MRCLSPSLLAVLVFAAASTAHAGGFELVEQSAPATGMAGAHTAVADDPAAIYYNPAGLGFQPGFGALVGGNIIVARTHVEPDHLTLWHTSVAPTAYVTQRFGKYVAFGFGAFPNFGEHFGYPPTWRGRFQGFFIDLQSVTFQPTLAIRPWSWLSIGVGVDVVVASFDIYRGLDFGGAEGSVHAGGNDAGVGGNVGVLLRIIPRHLNLGFTYRSRVDLDFDASGVVTVPPEFASMSPSGVQPAHLKLPLPHNFAVGLAGFVGHLVLSADIRVTLWRDLQQLSLTLGDLNSPSANTMSVPLDFHNTWSIRFGAQYGFMRDHLRVRLGAGYDESPVPARTLGPLLPDTDRGLVSVGLGLHWRPISADLGYMAVILVPRTSTNPDFVASFQSFGQVISGTITVQLEDVLQRHRAFVPEEN